MSLSRFHMIKLRLLAAYLRWTVNTGTNVWENTIWKCSYLIAKDNIKNGNQILTNIASMHPSQQCLLMCCSLHQTIYWILTEAPPSSPEINKIWSQVKIRPFYYFSAIIRVVEFQNDIITTGLNISIYSQIFLKSPLCRPDIQQYLQDTICFSILQY